MFNAIVTHFSRQGIAFQLIFLAWPHLLRTSTEPRRIIGSYSGVFILLWRHLTQFGRQPVLPSSLDRHYICLTT